MVSERNPSVGRLLEFLQDHTQGLLEQVRHQFRFEGRPEDSARAQHAEDICGKHTPIKRRDHLLRLRRSLVLDLKHRGLAICMV